MSGPEGSGRVPGVAVLGLSGRFPGGRSPAEFWANLRAGRESNVAAGSRLDDSGFDAAFFGMSGPAAGAMDPQHRLFLECAWEAFEHAGYVAERVEGPVAVFVAPGPASPDLAGDYEALAPLVSRLLNLTGPSMDVHTAGGASLASVHLACQSLLSGECDMALAGGGSRGPSATACVVLKRLEDAVRDGDQVLAVIRGSAINHSGARRAGDAASGLTSQVRVIGEALAMAGVHPAEVSYLEVHRAETGAGAPIEMVALTRAFRASTVATQFCMVGTVEGHSGHLGEAAGIVGLVKVVLALGHREIPPTLYVGTPRPDAHLEHSPFLVTTALRDWALPSGGRRIAGVAALSEGGTNLHLIVEEAPDVPPPAPSRDHHLLVLSARTPAALEAATAHLSAHLAANVHLPLGDVAYTLLEGRQPMAHRRVVVAVDAADAAHALNPAAGRRGMTDVAAEDEPALSVVWMCPGGASYRGMGAGLYAGERAYRTALDEALSGLDRDLETELRQLVCTEASAAGSALTDGTSHAVPALVAVEYAVGRLLQSWGVTPAAVAGAGPGEYAAACFAGVFNIQHAMALAAFECRLLQRQDADTSPDAFLRLCRTIPFKAPTMPLVSNATGRWMTDAEATDADSWARRLPRTGDVVDGVRTLMTLPHGAFVEVGPGGTLASLLAQQPDAPRVVTATLRRPDQPAADVASLLDTLGRLWAAGVPLHAQRLFAGERRRRVELPTYPFERQPCTSAPRRSEVREATAIRPDHGDDATGGERSSTATAGPSAAHVERELASMWRAVLDLEDVDGRENFFDLGGHSLSAVQLFRRIRDRFGVDLPLSTLFEAPTIAELAAVLQEQLTGNGSRPDPIGGVVPATPPARRFLVAVQPGAGLTPLFVVHGAGGHVLNITDLARAMNPQQPVLGLQAAGTDGVTAPATTIEQMADSYLDEVRAVQPHGPYLLAGYSGGGIIAFEMARRLQATGEVIGVLAFIDTFHPQMPAPRINLFTRLGRLRREGVAYLRDVLDRRRRSRRNDRDWRRIEQYLAAGEPIPRDLRELHLIRNFLRVASRYQPLPWTGQALLFRAEQVDYYSRTGGPTYGWDQTVLGGIETVPVPGDHDSIMRGANVVRIAHRLEHAISEATNRQDQDRRE